MKNKDIYNLYEGLYEISQDKELKFNIKTSYILAKNKHILEPFYNAISETKEKLINKYGKPKEDGTWFVSKEDVPNFTKEWNNFMDMDNFINLESIRLQDLEEEKLGIELMEKLLKIINN